MSARLRSICMSSGMMTKKSVTCLISAAGTVMAVHLRPVVDWPGSQCAGYNVALSDSVKSTSSSYVSFDDGDVHNSTFFAAALSPQTSQPGYV
jgi:hypothetical protein